MRVIIAGSRTIGVVLVNDIFVQSNNTHDVSVAVSRSGWDITEVVSGTAKGVDTLGEYWARELGIPVKEFPADWNQYGKRAGILRNGDMADYADALIAIWDGKSKGTLHMISDMVHKGKPVFVHCP